MTAAIHFMKLYHMLSPIRHSKYKISHFGFEFSVTFYIPKFFGTCGGGCPSESPNKLRNKPARDFLMQIIVSRYSFWLSLKRYTNLWPLIL